MLRGRGCLEVLTKYFKELGMRAKLGHVGMRGGPRENGERAVGRGSGKDGTRAGAGGQREEQLYIDKYKEEDERRGEGRGGGGEEERE